MNREVVPYLRCPVCREPLDAFGVGVGAARTLRCPRGHSFDIARQGYVDLSAGRLPHTGDTAAMVAARDAFLGAGHFDFVSNALAEAAAEVTDAPGLVVDAGAGTGHHLAAVLDRCHGLWGLALDAAKPAVRRAARAHPRAGAALCDVWRDLPVRDGAAALVIDVFAPRNGPEFRRILRPDGALLVVTPAADHLGALVDRLDLLRVDPAKEDRLSASLEPHFTLASRRELAADLHLDAAAVATVVGMGPSAWHRDPEALEHRIAGLETPVGVRASVRLDLYHPR